MMTNKISSLPRHDDRQVLLMDAKSILADLIFLGVLATWRLVCEADL